jgi:ABC-type glycerol-3-phosphate transport system substrate-binding protein
MVKVRFVATVIFVSIVGLALSEAALFAQTLREKAEAEGKLMFYATFNATDSKSLIDGFKQLYPKIEGTFYRSSDSAMMERIVTENRTGQNLWDVVVTSSFYGHNLKKRGL